MRQNNNHASVVWINVWRTSFLPFVITIKRGCDDFSSPEALHRGRDHILFMDLTQIFATFSHVSTRFLEIVHWGQWPWRWTDQHIVGSSRSKCFYSFNCLVYVVVASPPWAVGPFLLLLLPIDFLQPHQQTSGAVLLTAAAKNICAIFYLFIYF